jgi:biofilm PGA synthesis N-glycosyltransferase PgaC
MGATGVLNVLFGFLLARLVGTAGYSAGGPLLSIGTTAAVASVGIEFTATIAIVSSGSFSPLRHQIPSIAAVCVVVCAAFPLIAIVLRAPASLALVASLLAATTLAAAIPTAMLLSRGLVVALAVGAVGESLARITLLLVFSGRSPVEISLVVSVVVTVLGGVAMAVYALWRALPPRPSQTATRAQGSLGRSLLSLGVYIPLALPMWLARRELVPGEAGVVSLAALLGASVAAFAGPITSAVLPRIAAKASDREVRTGALMALGWATLAAGLLYLFAPMLLPLLVASSLNHFRSYLGPLLLAGIGWSMASYYSWVRATRGRGPLRYTAGCLAGIAGEVLLAVFIPGVIAISWGPLVGLSVLALVLIIEDSSPAVPEQGITAPPQVPVPVSVGLMAYNEELLIEANLRAMLAQRSDWAVVDEVIVVVSGSTDRTEEVVRAVAAEDCRVRLIVEDEKRGKVFSVQRFFFEARNELCVLGSSDVRATERCVESLVAPLLADGTVGMVGPRVEPEYRGGFVPAMHRFLWAVHNRLARSNPKAGEVIAVRRDLAFIDPVAGCDEVLLEASVTRAGARVTYAPHAVVHNLSPMSFADYLAHRRRIHVMHLVTSRELGYEPSSFSLLSGARVVAAEVCRRPPSAAVAVAVVVVEALGRALARRDVARGSTMISWVPSLSTRYAQVSDDLAERGSRI